MKTFSQAEVDELLAGAGMGMARPAEHTYDRLRGYGGAHVHDGD